MTSAGLLSNTLITDLLIDSPISFFSQKEPFLGIFEVDVSSEPLRIGETKTEEDELRRRIADLEALHRRAEEAADDAKESLESVREVDASDAVAGQRSGREEQSRSRVSAPQKAGR